jgi:hypothetical protein
MLRPTTAVMAIRTKRLRFMEFLLRRGEGSPSDPRRGAVVLERIGGGPV